MDFKWESFTILINLNAILMWKLWMIDYVFETEIYDSSKFSKINMSNFTQKPKQKKSAYTLTDKTKGTPKFITLSKLL